MAKFQVLLRAIIIFSLLSLINAQPQSQILAAWSIKLNSNSPTFSHGFYGPSCSSNPTSTSYYFVQNFTFPSSGVFEIASISSQILPTTNVQIIIFKNYFDPSSPCNNYVKDLRNDMAAFVYLIGDFSQGIFFFESNVQYFIVGMVDKDSEYIPLELIMNIASPSISGNFTAEHVWNLSLMTVDGVNLDPLCYTSSTNYYFEKFSWQQSISGFYDIYGGVDYRNLPSQFQLGLFSGTLSYSDLLQNNVCSFYIGQNQTRLAYALGMIQRIYLTAGQNYTLALTASTITAYGIQIVPTRRIPYRGGYTLPLNGSWNSVCAPDPAHTNIDVVGSFFITPYARTIITSGSPATIVAYSGDNSGNSTAVPETCPDKASFSGYAPFGTLLIASPDQTYSFILTPGSNSPVLYIEDIFVINGDPVPSPPDNFTTSTATSSNGLSTTTTTSFASTTTVVTVLLSITFVVLLW